jgi:protein phosphatase
VSKEKLSIEYSGASDIGMIRTENQDSFGKFPLDNLDIYSDKGQLFIVADGIGGHAGGKEASSLAVETISNAYFNSLSDETGVALRIAIEAANTAIHQKAQNSEKFGRMGTTCTSMVIKNNAAAIGQVGDSKVYRIEKNKIEQLTMEHTQLNEMLKEKILTEEEAKNYPSKSALSRALGMEEKVKADIIDDIPLKHGQIFVLCTDGLSKVNKEEILNIVTQNSPEDSCVKLINLANERGGKDNVTVQVLKINAEQISPKGSSLEKDKITVERKKKSKWLFIIPVLVILAAIGFLFGNSVVKLFNKETKEDSGNNQIINNEKSTAEKEPDNGPLAQADILFKKRNYEEALIVYQNLLEKEPMNLTALEAVNNIAGIYKDRADKLKAEKKFAEALNLYLKIQKIQPENIEVRNSVLICENQIKFSERSVDNNEVNYQVNGINLSDWNFINIDKSQYEIDGRSIKFFSTSFEKKSIINYNLNNADISADIQVLTNPNGGGAGIIFGYNAYSSGNDEKYYLLKFEGDNYILQFVENNSVEQLTVQKAGNNNPGSRNLGVKCSGNLINIYEGMNLTYSWKSQEKIYGKAGIYADKNVQVKFQNILIRGNK